MKRFANGIIILLLSVFLINSCSIEEPVLPRWVVPFIIPISKEKIVLKEELVNDSTIVSLGDTLAIQFEDQLDPEYITEEDLTVPGYDTTSAISLKSIEIDSLNNMSTGYINIGELLPSLQNFVGFTFYMPETTLTASPQLLSSDEFKAIKIESGEIELTIHNDLPFTLGPNKSSPEGLEIKIYEDSSGILISDLCIDEILPPGSVGTGRAPVNLTGDWIRTPVRLEYSLPIAKDTSFVLTQETLRSAGYQMDVSFIGLSVSEIVGKVPAQSFRDSWEVNFNHDNKVIRAKVSSGLIQLELQNQLPLGASVAFTLYDVKDGSGNPYTDQIVLQPYETVYHQINLNNFTIENSNFPGQVINNLKLDFQAETMESSGFVHIKNTDSIRIAFFTSDLKFNEFEGYLHPDELTIDPFEENNIVDYEGFSSGFQFQDAELKLELQNDIEIENLSLNLLLTGYHKDDYGTITDSAQLNISETLSTGDKNIILINGPEVANFLNILPTDVKGRGYISYGGYAHVRAGDQIKGSYQFTTPLKFKIVNPSPIELDPDTLYEEDIDEDIRDAVGDEIKYARLHTRILHHSPIGGEIQIIVTRDLSRENIFDAFRSINPELEFTKTVAIQKAQIDAQSGFVTKTVESEVDLELNTQELQVIKNPPFLVGLRMIFEDTDTPVVVRGSDFIEISGNIEVEVLVKDEE